MPARSSNSSSVARITRCKQHDVDATRPSCPGHDLTAASAHGNCSAPYLFVLSVMCHELAHIEQMNHSAEFKRVS